MSLDTIRPIWRVYLLVCFGITFLGLLADGSPIAALDIVWSSLNRPTVMQEEQPQTGADVSKRLDRVKHLLWHGNAEEALERLGDLLRELSLIQARSTAAKKVADSMTEFETYIRNNREFIPNFGERRRQGETISTAFVESTINQVVSRRFVKKQQMERRAKPAWS